MPRRGDILLYRGRGFFSHAIRFITGSEWSHCAWVWDSRTILESDWEPMGARGVGYAPLSKYAPERCRFVRPIVASALIEQALDKAAEHVGERYDFRLFIALLWAYARGRLWGTRKLASGRGKAWICSEIVATPLYLCAGFRFRDDVPVEDVVPGDVWSALEAAPPRVSIAS